MSDFVEIVSYVYIPLHAGASDAERRATTSPTTGFDEGRPGELGSAPGRMKAESCRQYFRHCLMED